MNFILNYFIIGLAVQLILVWASQKTQNEEYLFNHWERILITLLWPITLLSTLYYLIKTLFFDK